MGVVSVCLVNTLNVLELQKSTLTPLECVTTFGFCPYLYLENLDCILSCLWSFGQKLWKLPRKVSKEFQPPLPILCLLEIWIHWTMSTMRSEQILPHFIPTSKYCCPTSLGNMLNHLTFLWEKSFHFWLFFKRMSFSWNKLCPLFFNLNLFSGCLVLKVYYIL